MTLAPRARQRLVCRDAGKIAQDTRGRLHKSSSATSRVQCSVRRRAAHLYSPYATVQGRLEPGIRRTATHRGSLGRMLTRVPFFNGRVTP